MGHVPSQKPPSESPAEGLVADPAASPSSPEAASADLLVASHEMLFAPPDETLCDACGRSIEPPVDPDDEPSPGRGVYLWTRGGEARLEHVPLCAGCASAIGVTALARWEIEEEEG